VRFSVLAVAAIARVTTPEMLDAVLPAGDAEGAYERLRSLSFSEPVGDGLALHELVRKALRADLRRRAPDRDRELRRRITDHLFQRAQAGDPLMAIALAAHIDNRRRRQRVTVVGSYSLPGRGLSGSERSNLSERPTQGRQKTWSGMAPAARRRIVGALTTVVRTTHKCSKL
jgi:hypothetical protein